MSQVVCSRILLCSVQANIGGEVIWSQLETFLGGSIFLDSSNRNQANKQYIKCYNEKEQKYLITFSRKRNENFSTQTLIFFYYITLYLNSSSSATSLKMVRKNKQSNDGWMEKHLLPVLIWLSMVIFQKCALHSYFINSI